MLRKEFHLNYKNKKQPPYLPETIFSSLPQVPMRGFFSRATRSFVGYRPTRLRPKAERKPRMKSLWNPGYQSFTRQWKKYVACLYGRFISHSSFIFAMELKNLLENDKITVSCRQANQRIKQDFLQFSTSDPPFNFFVVITFF